MIAAKAWTRKENKLLYCKYWLLKISWQKYF